MGVDNSDRNTMYFNLGLPVEGDEEHPEVQAPNLPMPTRSYGQPNSGNVGQSMAIRRRILQRILQGYLPDDVAAEYGVPARFIKEQVEVARKELKEFNAANMDERVEESVEVFKMVQNVAWVQIDKGAPPEKFLQIINKSEEFVAKMRGVLTDKVQHSGNLLEGMKLYAFADVYPDAIEGEIVEVADDNTPLSLTDIMPKGSEAGTEIAVPLHTVPEFTKEMVEEADTKTQARWNKDADRKLQSTPPEVWVF